MSSIIAFVRALIMLACVLIILVLAVSHGEAISRATRAATGRLAHLSLGAPEEGDSDLAPAPARDESAAAARGTRPSAGVALALTRPAAPRERGSKPLPEPVDPPSNAAIHPVALAAPQRSANLKRGVPVVQTPSPPQDSGELGERARTEPPVVDWQERAAQLQEWGAVEYALEKWGSAGELYRFRCQVGLPGAESYRKHFQAVDGDGGRAIERVLQQVSTWHAGVSRGP